MSKLLTFVFVLFVAVNSLFAEDKPADVEIRKLIQNSVQNEKRFVGIAVGIVEPSDTRVISFGKLKAGSTNEVNGDTIFQIGSVTKTFTTLLLQQMIDRGTVQLDEPVAKLLPFSAKVPSRNGAQITLVALATHTSGLPRMPFKTPPRGAMPPVSIEDIFQFLSDYELTRDIGARYEYSNLGIGLLGHALSLKAERTYEALVIEEICEPLKMNSTRISITPEMKERVATAHRTSGEPIPEWRQPTLLAAGAICSSAHDMLKYLSAQIGLASSPLSEAMQKTQVPRHKAMGDGKVALGWHVRERDGAEIISHNGSTIGYHSFVGFDRKRLCGVVVLVNSANEIGDLPFQILKQLPLQQDAKIEK